MGKKKPMWQVLSDMGFDSVAVPIFKVAQRLEKLSETDPKQAIKSGEEYLAHKTHKKDTEYVQKIQIFVDHLKMEHGKQVKGDLQKFKGEPLPKYDNDSQFKIYQESYGPGLFVPKIDLKDRIRSKKKVKSDDFSILTHSFQKESLDLLDQTIIAFPKEFVSNLVCLLPESLLEHEILAQLQATIKLDKTVEDDQETFWIAFTQVKEKLKKNGMDIATKERCYDLYKNTSEGVTQLFNDLANDILQQEYPFISSHELNILQKFYTDLSKNEPWKSDNELLKSVCIQRGIALIYNKNAREIIEPEVERAIHALCTKMKLDKLEYITKDKAIAVFSTGGIASGKSTSLKVVAQVLENGPPEPILWNQLVHQNTDRLRSFLLQPHDPKRYSQYTYDEAKMITDRTMKLIAKKGLQSGGYPHFLLDQTQLKPAELKEANERYGKIIVVAVSTDVSVSLERAAQRGEKTRRFEHTEALLYSHQAVPGAMIRSLSQQELIGSDIEVTMFDQSKDKEQTLFATINMKNQEIIIYNEQMMQDWIKKETINPKAKPNEALYTGEEVRSIEEYFSPLIEQNFSLVVSEPNEDIELQIRSY
ncbi:zeta toxin family protein [Legionella sainthelensi]|uniref:Zeta toxin domain-containing protein n=1 Tax=Legionella sainthelensi TaxID=28087 RepID=A0A2H5FR10_9GAMM|nr:zeta toxin family protein [Legionella sainthelensi]AUH73982.1 hypothetical protein CAB17_12390 [Legionella sainthelensi]